MRYEYPSFTYNNESFIIIPGSRFTKNELKTRLRLMGVDDNNSQDKRFLSDLYESSLKNNQNKLKIISQLKKDTDNINAKLIFNQRTSLPSSYISNNSSQNKKMNISYEVNPFNSREQHINIIKPIHTNKGQYSYNPFISSNISHNQNNVSNISGYLNNNKQSFESSKIFENNSKINSNNIDSYNNMTNNNDSSYINKQDIYFKQKDNSIISNNNNDRFFSHQVEKQINNINNNSFNNPYLNNTDTNIKRNNNNSSIINQNYETEINNTINNNPINNKSLTYKENNFINNNYDNYNNNNERKTFTNQPNEIQFQEFNELNHKRYTNDIPTINNNNYINPYSTSNNQINHNNYNNKKAILFENQRSPNLSNENNNRIYNSDVRREKDEMSIFSIFSNLNKIKKYPFYKNKKYICFHLIIILLILCFTIGILNFISYSWESITQFFSDFLDLLIDPRNLFQTIFNFFSSLFFGAIHYFYITIPLIIFGVLLYLYIKRYYFKKRVEKIFKKIIQDMKKNISNNNQSITIYEDDIYIIYFQNKGISYKRFVKKYLSVLRKMVKNEPNVNIHSIKDNEKEIYLWKLN